MVRRVWFSSRKLPRQSWASNRAIPSGGIAVIFFPWRPAAAFNSAAIKAGNYPSLSRSGGMSKVSP